MSERSALIDALETRLLNAANEYAGADANWNHITAQLARAAPAEFSDPRHRARERWMAGVTNELLEAYEDWRSAVRKAS